MVGADGSAPDIPTIGRSIEVHCDGLCEPRNPGGIASYGFVARSAGGVVLREEGGFLCRGAEASNNVAEYGGAIRALQWALGNGYEAAEIVLHGDSRLLINQLSGEWAVRSPNIRPLWQKTRALIERFRDVRLVWVPREENEEANRLSVAAYVEVLEAERRERAREVEIDPVGKGLFLAQGKARRYLVDAVSGLCPCRDYKEINKGRFLAEAGFSVRCKHLLAAEAQQQITSDLWPSKTVGNSLPVSVRSSTTNAQS